MDAGPAAIALIAGGLVAIAGTAAATTWLGGRIRRRREHQRCDRLRARMALRRDTWQNYLAAEKAAVAMLHNPTAPLPLQPPADEHPPSVGRPQRVVVSTWNPEPVDTTTNHRAS